ncbi:tRNA (adenosine(37)-N6)-threonylcarbamoyltransferase complex ATPase subunit type 1 TsaE [Candidatus Campbellbacteria bacterium CG11_big_fil_rev_8_21_14_0_20_44_21]|uniref:tRNA threonylcarbamoyladenosine biosynthesis protein TsaE n=1 Tax=Candidatus Campbellbacteria bacterium CG22_combo_CG10-13_8_21_14_all_43_18 TaxID=1974530 RepID=A0A2H0DW12_9BACT|nr:MAG: tRNA (adenosine(37)-N6)-threonylcarbamoyltransferase complex ATPase subunit type 1 TsaE [Candidatus Campbellbacteria bacterium CG22_combo_CG10-13_8_21_14_all_43_18]PIR24213.1 MAG: tRNA (adenosine(37)-N6)-threonylcarbamoyltransferase complex ATPase subunit type 1 TsaE [Candidatus Campbellbacteria bacterium CG11_big_fil_rev_8_21_14_0_20_44_21]
MKRVKYLSENLQETKKIAGEFLKKTHPQSKSATVVELIGNLGSGKTAFVKAAAEVLGLKNTVSSPTFVIQKIYKLRNKEFDYLIHLDAYRLENGKELKILGWQNILSSPENLIFIEWPEKVSDILPRGTKRVFFDFVSENTREIKYET